jgi:hypothetical protein
VLWHELGCDAGAGYAGAKALAAHLTCAASKRSGAVALVIEQEPARARGALPGWTVRREVARSE